MTLCHRLGVDMPERGIQFVAAALTQRQKRIRRQGSSAVEQPRKDSGLVGSDKFHDNERVLCQGSSAVEQGTHKPLVGSSILPSGIFLLWPGFTLSRERRGVTILVRPLVSMPVLRSICAGTLRLQGALAED